MRKYIRYVKKLAPFLAILLIIAASYGSAIFLYKKQRGKQQADYDSKVSALQKQISGLQDKLVELAKQSVPAALPTQEIVNREVARQKSQDELLTAAVSKVSPAVVSIVISKDIQQLQIAYVNPFGDDPFFKDFGFQVPVYQPSGETQRQKIGAGTGFLITSDGYILTNKHVVLDDKADYTVLTNDGKKYKAKVLALDPVQDLAVIKIQQDTPLPVQAGLTATDQKFKPVILGDDKKPKGNIDADLVLRAMIDLHENIFNKTLIITSDGDFYSLVVYFYSKDKLRAVISPNKKKCSSLLRKSAKEKMIYLDNLKGKLEYKRKSTA